MYYFCYFRVPTWRRRLLCSICQTRNTGACIRCEMPNCVTAFHVTCAQQAGIYMRLELHRGPNNCVRAAAPRRTVFCDLHRPVETTAAVVSASSSSSSWNGDRHATRSPTKIADCLKATKKARKIAEEELATSSSAASLRINTGR